MRNNAAAGVSFTFHLVRDITASLWLFPWSQPGKFRGLQGILEARCCLGFADSPSKSYLNYLLNGHPWTHFLLRRFLSFLPVFRHGDQHDAVTLAGIKNFRAKQSLLLIGYGEMPGAYNSCRFNRLELQARRFVSDPAPRVKHFVKQVIGRSCHDIVP
jgi:hypothetical protein